VKAGRGFAGVTRSVLSELERRNVLRTDAFHRSRAGAAQRIARRGSALGMPQWARAGSQSRRYRIFIPDRVRLIPSVHARRS